MIQIRRALGRWAVLATLAVLSVLAGCADGDLEIQGQDPAAFGALGDQGDFCASSADCLTSLRCLRSGASAICVQPCAGNSQCASGQCNPVQGSSQGWCSYEGGFSGDGSHTPPGGDSGGDSGGAPNPPGDSGDDNGQDPWVDDGNNGGAPAPQNNGGAPEPPDDNDPPRAPTPQPQGAPDPGDPDPEPDPEPEPQPEPQPCVYPSGGNSISYNQVFPNLSWRSAFNESGATSFSMESFHCDAAYDNYGTIAFVIGAEWCGACPAYLRQVSSQAASLRAQGMLVVFVEAQDNSYRYPSSSSANSIASRYIGTAPSIRIGDGDTLPSPGTLYNVISSFPSAWVVRRSDMRLIADQSRSNFQLDLAALARQNPPQGSGGNNGGGGDNGGNNTPPNNNSGCQEESYEPNNAHTSAPVLGATSFNGGICGADLDFYAVNISGAWQLDLQFRHSDGDLDVYVWDIFSNQPTNVGSDSADDNESFTHSGWAVVGIVGYQGATAPYRLTITQR